MNTLRRHVRELGMTPSPALFHDSIFCIVVGV